jgi:phage repressor protein C with HTH and peptisase S24 domain
MRTAEELRAQVKSLRERAGLSVRAIAELLEMSPSGYSHYEQRIKEPVLPVRIADAMADALEVYGVPRHDVNALTRNGPNDDFDRVENGDLGPNGSALIPVYDVQVSAGFGALVDYEEQTHSLAFPPDYLRKLTAGSPKDLAIISTKGDSMEPTLLDDDIVLVDMSKTHMGYEGMFVLRHNDTLLVKRAGMAAKAGSVMLISDNKAYPPIEAMLADLHVVGKVLWYGRKV